MPRKSPTPPPLKWLTEKRARVAGDISAAEQIAAHLAGRVQRLEAKLRKARLQHQAADSRIERLNADLAAVDSSIRLFDATQDLGVIANVKAWAGRYGKRGAIKDAIEAHLRASAPAFISTTKLYEEMMVRFDLVHATWKERRGWICHTLRGQLHVFQKRGLVERTLELNTNGQREASWRWVQEKLPTMAQLRERDALVKATRKGDA